MWSTHEDKEENPNLFMRDESNESSHQLCNWKGKQNKRVTKTVTDKYFPQSKLKIVISTPH